MPTSTSRYAWPYAVVGDPPNGPSDEGGLANAIEATLGPIDDRYPAQPRGRIGNGTRSGATSNVGTTETVVDTITATLVSGRRYRFTVNLGIVGVATVSSYFIIMRYASGGSLTTAGTQLSTPQSSTQIVTLGNFEPRYSNDGEFVAPSSGTFTVGWTLRANAGTVRSDGGSSWHLDDIGL